MAPRTLNLQLALVRAIPKFAVADGHLPAAPTDRLGRGKLMLPVEKAKLAPPLGRPGEVGRLLEAIRTLRPDRHLSADHRVKESDRLSELFEAPTTAKVLSFDRTGRQARYACAQAREYSSPAAATRTRACSSNTCSRGSRLNVGVFSQEKGNSETVPISFPPADRE
jgi:hypothetical protein